jgi:ATP-dependent helicase HrpA
MISYPPELPISSRREEIVAALRSHRVLIVAGETGSGKTTQLPKMCLEAGLAERGRIGCTQPRRVAALSISRRVAQELGVEWGREVGCKMRFQDDTRRETRVKFMTDGILLAEIQSDPLLRAYSALILDEAHERSLNIDFLLGHLQGLLQKRPDLRVVVTSATIDTEAFSKAFGNAPIIEVSGRLWPVEIRYTPPHSLAQLGEAPEEITHIEAAVRAVEEALLESTQGDLLVFMPTERDIRETRDLLETSLGRGTEVIGLYGRMPAGEQQRIFEPGPQRRVIVSTNVAETSITLPRIRYVIDSGLSRMSRYNPRTRTKRLPVEPISQSSANQRAGRAGRIQDGICIRLYAEEEFLNRPKFTQPEIQRSNLGEVILRMKAFRLGQIETFPFLNPPVSAAIRSGYKLLHELGALDDTHELTPLGQALARLPIDPVLGRMLLHAREENALSEVLVIAAGLSVPDPRERPEEAKEAAASAHLAFAHPESDFLSLVNLWRAAPPDQGRASSNALRRFCKKNYLSFTRMREWRDLHRQLSEAMDAPPPDPANPAGAFSAEYPAVHRSILSGLLSQIALRQDRNSYKATGDRLVTLFPGSHLYERREKNKPHSPAASTPKKSQTQRWIMAGEIVETSQLFARIAAKIEPEWVLSLGAHLCSFSYSDPHWSAKAGRVLVLERALLGGLEIARSHVDFGKIDPPQATEIFLRTALVGDEIRAPHRFIIENRKVREKVETALTRVRNRRALDLDEALYRFYSKRISRVSSVHDLNQLVRERLRTDPNFLCATENDLIGEEDTAFDEKLFPDQITLGNAVLPLTYAYNPGEEADGVTVKVPLPVASQLTTGQIQWMVPGLREELAGVLLRALPKTVRKTLLPLEPKAREIATEFRPTQGCFLGALAGFISKRYATLVRSEDWAPQSLPPHLQPRIEIIDASQRTVATGRDLSALREEVEKKDLRSAAWEKAVSRWERNSLKAWTCGDLPESIPVEEIGSVTLLAYPGLRQEQGGVGVRLFRKLDEADAASREGLATLGKQVLNREMEWLRRELRGLGVLAPTADLKGAVSFQSALDRMSASLQQPAKGGTSARVAPEDLSITGCEHLLNHVLQFNPVRPLTSARFESVISAAKRDLPKLAYDLRERTTQLLTLKRTILAAPKRYPGLEGDLERLLPLDFLSQTPYAKLPHLLRYLHAVRIRAERAALSPAKDVEKSRPLAAFNAWEKKVQANRCEEFRWLLEEYRVSLFAQELGTAQPVSAQRLSALLELPSATRPKKI